MDSDVVVIDRLKIEINVSGTIMAFCSESDNIQEYLLLTLSEFRISDCFLFIKVEACRTFSIRPDRDVS